MEYEWTELILRCKTEFKERDDVKYEHYFIIIFTNGKKSNLQNYLRLTCLRQIGSDRPRSSSLIKRDWQNLIFLY